MTQPTAATTCVVRLGGPLAAPIAELLRIRYRVRCSADGDHRVLAVDDVDQAAVRAVMTTLWDSGHDILGMSIGSGGIGGVPD